MPDYVTSLTFGNTEVKSTDVKTSDKKISETAARPKGEETFMAAPTYIHIGGAYVMDESLHYNNPSKNTPKSQER